MIELGITHELLDPAVITTGLSLLTFGILAFSHDQKRYIRELQHFTCAESGAYDPHLSIHHRVPQCMGGADIIENGVGLSNKNGTHQYWDEQAHHGVIYPGIPINEVPHELFRSERERKQTLQRFPWLDP